MTSVLVALGGNALLRAREKGTASEQLATVARTAALIGEMVARGHEVVITHGNGPQIGNILLQNEAAANSVAPLPMDVLAAESQGQIGYMLQQALGNELRRRGISRQVVTLITQTLVSASDPALSRPSKPVGPFSTAAEARRRTAARGETWIEDAGRGWRRVVPSPKPLGIVEIEAIRRLRDGGTVVIAAGGGGVPVARRRDGGLVGVEGVVDKDLAAARLAEQLGLDILLILTDVGGVALEYGEPGQRYLGPVRAEALDRLARQGAFPAGSMGPKVEGAVRFVRAGGQRAVICALDDALEGLVGNAGTQIVARGARRARPAA